MAPTLKEGLRHPIVYSRELFQKIFKHRNSYPVKKSPGTKMGNQKSKASSNSSSSNDLTKLRIEETLHKLIEESNISGKTWEELASNLEKHIKSDRIAKEWEALSEKDEFTINNEMHLFRSATDINNKPKNRYANILPYDSTRVKLTPIEGKEASDYINANNVQSADRDYIATQAPLEHTVDDFYRMLWESNSGQLVMLTRFNELGRIKAHDYLPKEGEGPKKFGDIEVEVLSEQPSADESYVTRKIVLKKGKETLEVTQFHYLAWPDHGVPTESQPLLNMIIDADRSYPPEKTRTAPTTVHCSAGVGRTGTYIILNSILEQITNTMKRDANTPPTINMVRTLAELRSMRISMVNSEDQYHFCYTTILDHIKNLISTKPPK